VSAAAAGRLASSAAISARNDLIARPSCRAPPLRHVARA
jgi:hypothetical protein